MSLMVLFVFDSLVHFQAKSIHLCLSCVQWLGQWTCNSMVASSFLDFMVQEKINTGRYTDHPARRHSIRNQCPPPPSPHIFLRARCPSCHPTNSVKALKATGASSTSSWLVQSRDNTHKLDSNPILLYLD